MIRVKICGITNVDDALLAVELGAHALGFIFAESPRRVTPIMASQIIEKLPPLITKVGVFVDEDKEMVSEVAAVCGLDALQFHGSEPPEYCTRFKEKGVKVIKAVRVKNRESLEPLSHYSADAYLLDTHVEGMAGGTGVTFDWKLALEAKKFGPIILSGGLNSENVAEAIRVAKPFGVDVCSGVEKRTGKKDLDKLRAFFDEVWRVYAEICEEDAT